MYVQTATAPKERRRNVKEHFPKIFKKTIYCLDMGFDHELKEIQPNSQPYMFVNELDFRDDGSRSSKLGLPNLGILMPLLIVSYLKDHCASGGLALPEYVKHQ